MKTMFVFFTGFVLAFSDFASAEEKITPLDIEVKFLEEIIAKTKDSKYMFNEVPKGYFCQKTIRAVEALRKMDTSRLSDTEIISDEDGCVHAEGVAVKIKKYQIFKRTSECMLHVVLQVDVAPGYKFTLYDLEAFRYRCGVWFSDSRW